MLKIAILGCGRIYLKHKKAILESLEGKAIIVGVCDIVRKKADIASKELNVNAYYSIEDLKKNCKFDLISILTPSGYHAEHVVNFAGYCPYIVVEKPMCINYLDGLKMLEICSKKNSKLFVVKQNRFNKPIVSLKKAIDANELGTIFLATSRVRWTRDQNYFNQNNWRGKWKLDGGVLANQASHHLDLLNWILGEDIKSVFAKSLHINKSIEAEDTAAVIFGYESDKLGIIEATTATKPSDLEGSLSVLGSQGTVEIGGFAVNEMKIWKVKNDKENDNFNMSEYPSDVYGFGHGEFYKHIYKSINENLNSMLSGENGIKLIKILNAIQTSIYLKKEIMVDQENFISHYTL